MRGGRPRSGGDALPGSRRTTLRRRGQRGWAGLVGSPCDGGFCFGPLVDGSTLEPRLPPRALAGTGSVGELPLSGAVGSVASLAMRLSSIVTIGSRLAWAFS